MELNEMRKRWAAEDAVWHEVRAKYWRVSLQWWKKQPKNETNAASIARVRKLVRQHCARAQWARQRAL